ncbi:MAG: archaeosortase/exosortase family protein [Planctomycetota bacterium]|jgi:exosortase/archaeosortase family protein
MSRKRNPKKRQRAAAQNARDANPPDSSAHGPRGLRKWLRERPVLRFVGGLALLLIVFHTAFYLWLSKGSAFNAYLFANAEASACCLNSFGEDTKTRGTVIASQKYNLDIKRGCDGIQASALFVLAVLVSPLKIRWRARLIAMLVGTVLLLLINVVRIISLYYIGVHIPKYFDLMHIDVWQAIFVFLPITFWFAWSRAMESRAVESRAVEPGKS